MNKLLLYSVSLFFLAQAAEISKNEGLIASERFDFTQIFKAKKFEKLKDTEYFKVHNRAHDYDMHAVLHQANHDAIDNFEQVQMSPVSTGGYTLMAKANVIGNVRGTAAGFWLSKFLVHVFAQTLYAVFAGVTSLVYPPAAPVVYCSLQLTFAAFVEIISNMFACKTILAFS